MDWLIYGAMDVLSYFYTLNMVAILEVFPGLSVFISDHTFSYKERQTRSARRWLLSRDTGTIGKNISATVCLRDEVVTTGMHSSRRSTVRKKRRISLCVEQRAVAVYRGLQRIGTRHITAGAEHVLSAGITKQLPIVIV